MALLPLLLQLNYPSILTSAGSLFTEQTVTLLVEIFVILAMFMQLSRGYFLRVLRKFTLRFAADIWWILFVLLRDGSIFIILFLGVTLFWPGTYQDYPIAMPFQLLGVDFFAFALVLLLLKDTDEEPKYNSLLSAFIMIGGLLILFGTIFVTENPVQTGISMPTVSSGTSNFWGYLYYTFASNQNPTLSIYSFYACIALLAIAGGTAFNWAMKQSMADLKKQAKLPKP